MHLGPTTDPHLVPSAPQQVAVATHAGPVRAAEPVVPPAAVGPRRGAAAGLIERRRPDRGGEPPRRPLGRTLPVGPGPVRGSSPYLSQLLAQTHSPAPKTPHRLGVAAYPSLASSVEVISAVGLLVPAGAHAIDLFA